MYKHNDILHVGYLTNSSLHEESRCLEKMHLKYPLHIQNSE